MVVRELLGVMASQGAKGGVVVTSGSFTREAESFAQTNGIALIGADELNRMIQAAKSSIQIPRHLKQESGKPEQKITPSCPACNAAMVKRTATRGDSPGSKFWGCSRFPKCRGTISIS
jgi:restriction system protein